MAGDDGDILRSLKRYDPDRYLATLFAPSQKRHDLAVLYTFNFEISRIRDVVSEPMLGEVRIQWWRDTLSQAGKGQESGHPLAGEMDRIIKQHALPRTMLENYFDARIFDLYDDAMPTINDLEGYCGETAGIILQFASMILHKEAIDGTGEAAGHAACAQAITDLLRLLPLHRSRGQSYIPRDILSACGLDRETWLSGLEKEKAGMAVTAMAAKARSHLAHYNQVSGQLEKRFQPAYQILACIPAYLDVIERNPVESLTCPADISSLKRFWCNLRFSL